MHQFQTYCDTRVPEVKCQLCHMAAMCTVRSLWLCLAVSTVVSHHRCSSTCSIVVSFASCAERPADKGVLCCGVLPNRWTDTAVARASDDFYPRDPASITPHISACAFLSVFLSPLVQPDWDMFHRCSVRIPHLSFIMDTQYWCHLAVQSLLIYH
jgi:hypothetical protein